MKMGYKRSLDTYTNAYGDLASAAGVFSSATDVLEALRAKAQSDTKMPLWSRLQLLDHVAQAYLQMKDLDTSLSVREDSYKMALASAGATSPEAGIALGNIGLTLSLMGRHHEGISNAEQGLLTLQKAKERTESAAGKPVPWASDVTPYALGRCLALAAKTLPAGELQTGIARCEEVLRSNGDPTAESQYFLAEAHISTGNIPRGIELLEEAFAILGKLESRGQVSPKFISATRLALARAYSANGEPGKADSLMNQ